MAGNSKKNRNFEARMRYLCLILLVFAMAFATSRAAEPASSWEQTSTAETPASVVQTERDERIDVTVRDGYIYVTTPKPVTVRVMTILGQLISQQQVPAGTSRLKVTARGIYILKAGTVTKRVTI